MAKITVKQEALDKVTRELEQWTSVGKVPPLHLYLKKLRLEIAIPQSLLGERLGVTEAYVSYIETGNKLLTFQMLIKWHKALRRPISLEAVAAWLTSRRGVLLQIGKDRWRCDLAARLCLAWPSLSSPTAQELSDILDRSIKLQA